MTDIPAKKVKRAMSKEEVTLLVDLIAANPFLNSKETNAASNRIKEELWTKVEKKFNARSRSMPRSKDQIKLKWDNLKKNARKRASILGQNNIETGGEKSIVGPDEISDKVISLLGPTCTVFPVPFGGDTSPPQYEVDTVDVEKDDELGDGTFHDITPPEVKVDTSCGPYTSEGNINRRNDIGLRERNLAIALYYTKKAEKIEVEIQLLKKQLDPLQNT